VGTLKQHIDRVSEVEGKNIVNFMKAMKLCKEAKARAFAAAEIPAEFQCVGPLPGLPPGTPLLTRSFGSVASTPEAAASALEGEFNEKLEKGKPVIWRDSPRMDSEASQLGLETTFRPVFRLVQAPDVATARAWCGLPPEEATDAR
jgi:hypothetical protein